MQTSRPPFRLRVLGGAVVLSGDTPLGGPVAQRHRIALLALLAPGGSHPVTRDKLIAYLWPERDAEPSRNLLKVAVHELRKAVGEGAIRSTGDQLSLDSDVLPSDVADFQAAVARGDDAAAVGLYSGPFLDGFFLKEAPEFERWVDGERDRLASAYAQALERLAKAADARADYDAAVRWWRALAAQDPHRSAVAQKLMRALAAAGDVAGAVRYADIHAARRRQDLELDPDPDVVALAAELSAAPRTTVRAPSTSPAAAAAPAPEPSVPRSPGPPVPRSRSPLRFLPWAAALVVIAIGFSVFRPRTTASSNPNGVLRYPVPLPDSERYGDNAGPTIAYAHDASVFAYSTADRGIALRYTDRVDPVPVTAARLGTLPFFSPDARWLGYRQGHRVLKVALAGGTPVVVCDSCDGRGFDWGMDDTIRYHEAVSPEHLDMQLMAIPAAGGNPRVIAKPEAQSGFSYRWPVLLPDGHTVLFTMRRTDEDRLAALDTRTGAIARFDVVGSNPHYVAAGFVVLANRDGSLVAVAFDLARGRPSGRPVTIARDVIVDDNGSAKAAVSQSGAVVYAQLEAIRERHLVLVDRDGHASDLTPETKGYTNPRVSPDGRRIAMGLQDAAAGGPDVWVYDLDHHSFTRLTSDHHSEFPVWMPDGRRIVFSSSADLWWTVADGSARADSLYRDPGSRFPTSVTPDGKTVVMLETHTPNAGIRAMPFGPWLPFPPVRNVIASAFAEGAPALSPDGRWLAYQSFEPAKPQVFVRLFPGPGPRLQVSLNGGTEPAWSKDGRELYYREGDAMMVATMRPGPALAVIARRRLFSGPFLSGSDLREYDVTPDGHFVMVRASTFPTNLIAVHGFFDQLK